jgi:DNA-binding transcriptional MerR regulator
VDKSPEAFRTISEVADALETPAHVLRFWESRFPQIRPVKRAGGRRYYRPADVALLTGIKRLLHDEGMTIRGVQKILREQGIRHVSGLSDDSSPEEEALDAAMSARFDAEPALPAYLVEDETAAALAAALDAAPEARVVPFAPVAPPVSPPNQRASSDPASDDALTVNTAAAPQETLDWLASLPPEQSAAGAAATTSQPQDESDDFDVPAPETGPLAKVEQELAGVASPPEDAAPTAPAETSRPAAPAPIPDPALLGDEFTATLAARLRALPRGSLSRHPEALAEIAARIGALRDRLGGLPPRV